MRLLLTSFLHPLLSEILGGRVAYIGDAARTVADAPFARQEREAITGLGATVVDLPLATTPLRDIGAVLRDVDGVYVAGGETFDLLHVLRSTGADRLVVDAVRAGLAYASSSAGSIVAGPSIGPSAVMDDPAVAPGLTDYRGLGLTQRVIVPHAQGSLPPFPIEVVARTVAEYGETWPLLLLRDGEALLVDDDGEHLV